MHRNKLLAALALLIAAQIAVPVSMIAEREEILEKGTVYHFKSLPVDPTDVMRGKYVVLNIPHPEVAVPNSESFGDELFAFLSKDSQGFARVDSVSSKKPDSDDYLKVKIAYRSKGKVHLSLPFDRFYMEETKAPAAEKMLMQAADSVKAYAKVRILRGESVIEDVIVNGRPISELAAEQLNR